MSDLLGRAQNLASGVLAAGTGGLAGWRAAYRAASFRGAAFKVVDHTADDGRRVAEFEFPLRDKGFTEDLGRSTQRWRITGYVIGDDYFTDRDALVEACGASNEPGTLVHPFLGEKQARCVSVSYRESNKEGRFCTFDLVFVDAGQEASPTERNDTLGQVISTAKRVMKLAKTAYAIVTAARGDLLGFAQGVLLGFASDLVSDLTDGLLALPLYDVLGIVAAIEDLADNPFTDPDSVAGDLTAPYLAVVDADPLPVDALDDGVAIVSRSDAEPAAEPFQVLVTAAALPVPFSADATEQAALVSAHGLAMDAAVVAAAQAASQAAWPSADAALAARDSLMDLIEARSDAAADAGQDALFAGWRALAAAVQADLTDRAAQLPRIAAYALPGVLPAAALAQRLYGGAGQADALVALNGVPHPLFMPAEGRMLRDG
ncbi:DNA circularization N-terminal domain-containing protein [Roseomonas sp. HJA6]|uniref:DNA circularization N-terminal domain-containing protein n=1 Tax=Roseomonas alba TaxID=2846776 RepID=A0ABS7ACG1_9PROT|nr:DNA circularization N-terminal domain-containing protein [Neoroseomonas alba]MBW6399978.1 DNA circularization N-terminal domain-containing protein [Neoroseomonas alba]